MSLPSRTRVRPTFPLMALLLTLSVGGCSCAIGRPGDGDTGITDPDMGPDDTGVVDSGPDDTGVDLGPDQGPVDMGIDMPDVGNTCPNALPGEPVTCGDGFIDSESLEVCDPCAPTSLNNASRCLCETACEAWQPSATLGQCFGSCARLPYEDLYGIDHCDDGRSCTVDTVVTGTPGQCDVTCSNEPMRPVDDDCDGEDDDCDGTADDDYVPMDTTCGLGICASTGRTSCVNGIEMNSCVQGTPDNFDASCDGIDQNCNGVADDEFMATSTNCGIGACARTGLSTCSSGALGTTCVAGNPLGVSDATCNNVDDDCDGMTDEDYAALTTTCGTGECARTGMSACVSGSTVSTCVAGLPTSEVCNNLDDNCDGTIDDGVRNACGGCGPVPLEVCDGTDNDCDGSTDEGTGGASCSTGMFGICNAGTQSCVTGSLQCVPNNTPQTEVCDGLDNDCDGTVNDGNPGGGGACVVPGQQGPCASGTYVCGSGDTSIRCSQTTFSTTESCNNVDDDCDGTADDNVLVSSDTTPNSCGAATNRTIMVGAGGNQLVSGTVDPSGEDWFYVQFSGVGGANTSYRPTITLLSDTSKYRFQVYQSCSQTYSLCGSSYDNFSMTYAPTNCTDSRWNNCSDNTPRRTTFWVRVFRSPSVSSTDCAGWQIRVSNQ